MAKLYFRVGSDWEVVQKLREEISKLESQLKSMDANKAPAAVKTLNNQINQAQKQFRSMTSEAAKAAVLMDSDFKSKIYKGSQAVNDLSEKIILQRGTVQKLKNELTGLKDKYKEVLKQDGNTSSLEAKIKSTNDKLKSQKEVLYSLTQQQSKARLSVKQLRDEYALYDSQVKDTTGSTFSLGKAFGVIGGVAVLKQLGSEIINVRGQFRSMEISLETMVGESKAKDLLAQIKQYAAISPLELKDVQSSTEMMIGFNVEAEKVPRYIQAIGDISRGESQKFQSLSLAFSQMSAAGKLMGQDLNQMINAGFNPLQMISEKTGKSMAQLKDEMSKGAISAEMVQQAFIDATSAGGKFYGMSEKQSQEVAGQMSILSDTINNKLNEIGESNEGIIKSGISGITSLVNNYEEIGKVLAGLITVYGAYRTALILNIALEKAQAIQRLASINGVTSFKVLTDMLTASLSRLNVALAGKGFALIGAAAVASSLMLMNWANEQDKASKGTERFNIKQQQAVESEKNRRREVERNIAIASDEKRSTIERAQAIEYLKSAYKNIIPEYDKVTYHLRNILDYTRKINQEDGRNRIVNIKTNIVLLNREIERYKNGLKEANRQAGTGAGQAVQGIYNHINDLEAERNKWQDLLKAEDTKISSKSTNVDKVRNKEYWEGKKQEAQTALDALSDIDAKSKKGDILRKKISDYDQKLSGYSISESAKQENQAEKLRHQTNKYNVLLSKQAIEEKRTAEDLQTQVDEARIKAMDDGSQKTIAQMELNFEKEMQSIDRQKEDALRKKIDDARSAFEANPKNKGKSFDASSISLSDNENKYFDELYKAGITNYDKIYDEYINRYQSYTDQRIAIEKKFNDDIAILQEARKKAQEQGDKDEVDKIDRSIAKATTEKGKALMQNSFDILKQSPDYIRAFEDLKNVSNETLTSLAEQFERVKDAAAAALNPEDLREYTTTIQELMDELNSRDPFKAMVERQEELTVANMELANAKKQLDAVNNGAKIVSGMKSTKFNNGKISVENTYLTASEALEKYNKAKDKSIKVTNDYQKAEKSALEKVNELISAIDNVGESIGGTGGELISFMADIVSFVSTSMNGITALAQTGAKALTTVEKASVILTIISAAIQLMQTLDSLMGDAHDKYEKYAEKIGEINKLTDAVNDYRIAVIEANQAEENWFSEDNLKNLRDYKELQEEVYQAYIDKATEAQAIYKNESGGGWLTNAAGLLTGQWFMDNVFGTNLRGKDYEKGTTAAINNLRIETRKKSSGFLGSGIGSKSQKTEDLQTWVNNNKDKFKGLDTNLFDSDGLINKELAQSILENYGDKLVGQTKETLDALIKLRDQYDEYIKQLHEYVSSLYEPLVDNFVDSLWNWFDSGKDALDSFKKYASDTFRDIVSDMLKTIVLDKVVGTYKDDIAIVYENYSKGKIDETELMKQVADLTKTLIGNYETNIPTLENILNEVNDYLSNAGIDLHDSSSSSSQEASSKGFQTMDQDTGNELNGRFTSLQIASEIIKQQSAEQTMSLKDLASKSSEILTVSTDIRNIADDTRTILANTYLETIAIRENTEKSARYLKDIKSDIADVKVNTKAMAG